MILSGVIRLGRDAELKQTDSGAEYVSFTAVYEHGRKGDDGKRPAQWILVRDWRKQGKAMLPYLLKGKAMNVTLDDVYGIPPKEAGQSVLLRGDVIAMDFCPLNKQESQQTQQSPRQAPQQQAPRQAPPQQQRAPQNDYAAQSGGYDDDSPPF